MTRLVCADCHRVIEEAEARRVEGISIMLTINGRREPFQASEILCAQAVSKGVNYTLNDGRQAFEYHTLRTIAARHPEFIQIHRDTLVRADAITAIVYDGEERFVELVGGSRLQASRRLWMATRRVAEKNPSLEVVKAPRRSPAAGAR